MTADAIINQMGLDARKAVSCLASASALKKNSALEEIAKSLIENINEILAANKRDIDHGIQMGMKKSLLDRLTLTKERILGMAEGVREVIALEDPIGALDGMVTRPNGLKIGKMAVPMGVIGIIYEARPNVTVDAAALCLKSGNVCILRGGKEAVSSSECLAEIMRRAVEKAGFDKNIIQLVTDTSRDSAVALMKCKYLDLLIPRGGAGLIRAVVDNATVPVIETGVGNCHVYIDSSADLDMGVDIIVNAKAQRPSVCNAAESLLVHKDIAAEFLPKAAKALREKNVELRGCAETQAIIKDVIPATDEDFATEYNDYILAIKVVDSLDAAISHISEYSTHHSEAIVTSDYFASRRFLEEVDAAAVYVNASTRFTDGNEFGFGAEIGISTQKLHVRGPMGLKALTTTKYIILGNGQIR